MIPVRNIYHMLAYAFQKLQGGAFSRCATESFENIEELIAGILCIGIATQLKRGLERDYRNVSQQIQRVKGKINLEESIRTQSIRKQALVCEFDLFDENSYLNRILKTTISILIKRPIRQQIKRDLRKLLFYFRNIDTLQPEQINWHFTYRKNNQSYQQLINFCLFALKGLLQTQTEGANKTQTFMDEQSMCRLYEKFILNYFRKEHPKIRASSEQINWALAGERSVFLPIMQSDITLRRGNKTLIIDAKYYNKNLQTRYQNSYKIHSNNLYQIYTYVDNYRKQHLDEEVTGMLLYAQTNANIQPNACFPLRDVPIEVRTLDLNLDFRDIASQLDTIAENLI